MEGTAPANQDSARMMLCWLVLVRRGMGLRYNTLYTQSLVLHGIAPKTLYNTYEEATSVQAKILFIHIPITTAIAI